MKRWGKRILVPVLALAVALLLELLAFNRGALTSGSGSWEALPPPEVTGNLGEDSEVRLRFSGLNRELGWCHILIEVRNEAGEPVPTCFSLELRDEGDQWGYDAGAVSYLPGHDKASWFRLHSYGRAQSLTLILQAPEPGCSYVLRQAEIGGRVPFRISLPRIGGIFALLVLLYLLRPGSRIHDNRFWNRRRWTKTACVVLIVLLNFALLAKLAVSNDAFVHISDTPRWEHHLQYARLARSLAEGRTNIDTPEQAELLEVLGELKNPYDQTQRSDAFKEREGLHIWDSAYYNGRLYVYFGVVPVLLTYLPFYLLTGRDLPTVYAAILSYGWILAAAWLLMRAVLRRWFPRAPFSAYCLLSVLLGNCTGALADTLESSFYVLPITFSLGLILTALSLWISAAERLAPAKVAAVLPTNPTIPAEAPADAVDPADAAEPADSAGETRCFAPAKPLRRGGIWARLALGSLCAALVAGCRPQFLVCSALAIPIFLPVLRRRQLTPGRALAFLLPYAAVAAPLMYYNFVRFGSVFDFGANYNLTTNDMTHRGWSWDRLPDGLFAYLLSPPRVSLHFPWLRDTAVTPIYLGRTVREEMFGGVPVLFPFLWQLPLAGRRRGALRRKGLLGLTLLPPVLALIVVLADTQMAGILWRYTGDFLLLLYLPAILIFLAGLEQTSPERQGRKVFRLALVTLLTLLLCLLISVSASSLETRDPAQFYRLKDFLNRL